MTRLLAAGLFAVALTAIPIGMAVTNQGVQLTADVPSAHATQVDPTPPPISINDLLDDGYTCGEVATDVAVCTKDKNSPAYECRKDKPCTIINRQIQPTVSPKKSQSGTTRSNGG